MIPILFPYTYLSPRELGPLSTLFGKILIYQPIDKLFPADLEESFRSGKIEIRIPLKDNDKMLKTILKEYRTWADLHHISQREYHKITHSFNLSAQDPMSSQIRQEIRDRMSGEKEHGTLTPTDNARLFLALAQEFDMQQTGLSREINQIQDMQQQLFKNLRGDGPDGSASFSSAESSQPESHDYMTSERLSAWSHLMCHDTQPARVFITTSSSAFQRVSKQAGLTRKISGFDSRPVEILHKEKPFDRSRVLTDYFDQVTQTDEESLPDHPFGNEDAPAADRACNVRLTVSMVPNQSSPEVFGKQIHSPISETPATDTDTLCRNTVLALIELPVA